MEIREGTVEPASPITDEIIESIIYLFVKLIGDLKRLDFLES